MNDKYEQEYQYALTLTPALLLHRISSQSGQVRAKGPGWEVAEVILKACMDAAKAAGLTHPELPTEEPLDVQAARKLIQLYQSADRRGKDFDLTAADVKRLLRRKRCAYTGVTMTRSAQDAPLMPTDRTIDRLDPSKGYVKGNVFAVTHQANRLKNELFEWQKSDLYSQLRVVEKLCASLRALGFKQE